MGRRLVLLGLVAAFGIFAVAATFLGQRMSRVSEAARALSPRAFETPAVVFVGTGGSYADPLRRGPAIALGSGSDVVLVDAGRGVAEGLRGAGIPVEQPRAVYLSSLLPENTAGLDDLLSAGWLAPRRAPLRVVGPPGTRALADGLAAAHRRGLEAQGRSFGLPPEGARIEALELRGGEVREEGAWRISATALEGGPLPALAFRVEVGDVAVALPGAAFGGDALVELARGATLLVHEAFFAESVELAIQAGADEPERLRSEAAQRTPLAEAGARAQRAGARTLALVRLRPPPLFDFQASRAAGAAYAGRILVPADGDELALTP
jgi:ribonuclease Z